jgi:lipopolysaccharide/colanic/teichoic acid biosynthesis glycosyltransferase
VIKRLIDVLLSALGLLALSPIMVVVAAAELWFHGWPPLFTQLRSGQNGRVFRLFKFRSMTNERGPDGELLSDERRLTPFGQWLRRTSLDELPQLLNILKGDMSVVGPRPLLPRYHTRYSPLEAFRLLAKPGLTGWAAVNGRSTNVGGTFRLRRLLRRQPEHAARSAHHRAHGRRCVPGRRYPVGRPRHQP